MVQAGTLLPVSIDEIELDRSNPRIRKFLEMYGDDPTPDQIYLALGAGGDDGNGGATSNTTFEKLKQSILTNGGVIQPVILNRQADGTLICVEGNTRVALYRQFSKDGTKGDWSHIPALVHEGIDEASVDAIRLQVHLVGPRQWDPYSKAKYLHHLRTQEHLPFSTIVDYCGGRQREVEEIINAYSDMERHYRPFVEDDGSFDTTRFSGFVELQKPGVKRAIAEAGFDLDDFSQWIHSRRIYPLNKVRVLTRILPNREARAVFLRDGIKEAEKLLDRPSLDKTLKNAEIEQLARALSSKIGVLPYEEFNRIKHDLGGDKAQALLEVQLALAGLIDDLTSGG